VAMQGCFGQQRGGKCAGCGRLAEPGLTNEEVRVSETPGLELRSELIERSRVPRDAGKGIGHATRLSAARRGHLEGC